MNPFFLTAIIWARGGKRVRNNQQEKYVQGLSGEGVGRQGSLGRELIRNVGLWVSDQANCLLLMVLLKIGREDFDTIPVNKGDCMKGGWLFFAREESCSLIPVVICWEEDDVLETFLPTFSWAIILWLRPQRSKESCYLAALMLGHGKLIWELQRQHVPFQESVWVWWAQYSR